MADIFIAIIFLQLMLKETSANTNVFFTYQKMSGSLDAKYKSKIWKETAKRK